MVEPMTTIYLAVLFAVVQATPPIPRHTSDQPRASSDSIKKQAYSDKTPPQSISPVEQKPGPFEQKDRRENQAKANTQEAVRVTEFPAVSINTDWWSRASVLLTLALVIVGAVGTKVALRTLRSV